MRSTARARVCPRRWALLAGLLGWMVSPSAAPAQHSAATTDQIVHVLNRLGYGPRAGDVERVRQMGLQAYIDLQLHPERIPDSAFEARLQTIVPTLGWSLEALMDDDRPAAGVAVRRRDPLIQKVKQRDGGSTLAGQSSDPDSMLFVRRSLHNAAVTPMLTRSERRLEDFKRPLDLRVARALYSDRQLLETLVDFWFNHFNITSGDPYVVIHWTEQVIRRHALGKFEDLLVATATHPAMMLYLDNWLSAAPAEVLQARLAVWKPPEGENRELAIRRRQAFFDQTKGLNENYARELMELHTLGVDGGYTQQDVQQVARAFTGWTLGGPREDGAFAFEPLIHEAGDKVVLGRTIKSGGMEEGREILRMLAHHPSTAHFISFKLARRFVADDPPASVVEAGARTFLATGGDIREVLRTIFTSAEFMAPEYQGAKIKKPIDMVFSALRAVSADIDFGLQAPGGILLNALRDMGEPLGQHEAPDGYPEVASAWISTNGLYQRMNFSLSLTSGQLSGIRIDLEAAERLFREMGMPEPTDAQIAEARSLIARRAAIAAGGAQASMMMMADETQDNSMRRRNQRPSEPPGPTELRAIAAAVHLGSPAFQKR